MQSRSHKFIISSFVFMALFGVVLAYASMGKTGEGNHCKVVEFKGSGYTVCKFHNTDDIRLFWGDGGQAFTEFTSLDEALKKGGKRLSYAMNAGMYHPDRAPVGLYIDEQGERARLQVGQSYGNFGMVPNGVFYRKGGNYRVMETVAYKSANTSPDYATQSGPMLVIDNQLHPKFKDGSSNKRIRNGVGVSANGQEIYFVISDQAVNFYDFASLFRDELSTPNALYLDGNVSRIYDAQTGRSDSGLPMGPMIGVVN